MNEQQEVFREKLTESISQIIDAATPEKKEPVESSESLEEVVNDSPTKSEEELEEPNNNTDEEEAKEDAPQEVKENSDDKGLDLKKKLSGQPREFRDAVESIKDPEDQARVLEAGKFLRAREDQVRLELGNTKKELAGFKTFEESLKKDPVKTIKDLAKFANIDLSSLSDLISDEYDYRTPEEIKKDEYYKNIDSRLSQIETQKQREASEINAREIEQFKSAKDSDGSLKHPHFEKVRLNMAVFYSEGNPLYNPDLTLEQAYKKAVLLDDELVQERDVELTKKAAEKRKEEIEKAKKLKKFSGRTSSASISPLKSRQAIVSNAVEEFFAGTL